MEENRIVALENLNGTTVLSTPPDCGLIYPDILESYGQVSLIYGSGIIRSKVEKEARPKGANAMITHEKRDLATGEIIEDPYNWIKPNHMYEERVEYFKIEERLEHLFFRKWREKRSQEGLAN